MLRLVRITRFTHLCQFNFFAFHLFISVSLSLSLARVARSFGRNPAPSGNGGNDGDNNNNDIPLEDLHTYESIDPLPLPAILPPPPRIACPLPTNPFLTNNPFIDDLPPPPSPS